MLQTSNQPTAESYLQQGNTYLAVNELPAAISAYCRALNMDPDYVEALYNCGVAYHQQGRLDQAVRYYTQALQRFPRLVEAQFNLAAAYCDLNRLDDSELAYLEALRLQPENAAAAYNLGLLYQSMGKQREAMERFEQALKIRPDYAEAANNIGVIHRDQDNLEQAMIWLQRALAIKSDFAVAMYNMGVVYQKKGKFDLALTYYQKASAADDLYSPAKWLYLLALPMHYDTPEQIAHYRQRFSKNLSALIQSTLLESQADRQNALQGLSATSNFYLQYQGRNDLTLQLQYGRFAAEVMAANFPQWAVNKPMPKVNSGEKIRVGYASSCIYSHTIGIFLLGWLGNGSHSDFEWFCYHVGDRTDALTGEIAQRVDHFYHFPGNLTIAASQIEKDNLHILVHTDIGMNPITLQLAALRLAPVQCKGWGHPVTTGLPTIDYYLSSDLMETNESQNHYCEELIRLPNLALNYTPPMLPSTPKSRREFGIPDQAIVFLSTQSLFKYLPQNDGLYAKIGQQIPQAVFVFIGHKEAMVTDRFAQRLAACFAAHNTPFNCIFLPRLNHDDFLSLNLTADVLLDTPDWSGGKTTLEALVCDLPVVTLPGALMRGRHAYAFLTRMGLTETIAADPADYIQKAICLGGDHAYRNTIKHYIQKHKGKLFYDCSVNNALENFYRQVASGSFLRTTPGQPSPPPDMNRLSTMSSEEMFFPHSQGTPGIPQTINRLYAQGNTRISEKRWREAAVCFERTLAHIPSFFGVNLWYQHYLMDGEALADCPPSFVAEIYAKLSLCRLELGRIEDGLACTNAALRLDPNCMTAQRIKANHATPAMRCQFPDACKQMPSVNQNPSAIDYSDKISILVISSFAEKMVQYKELAPPSTGLVKATFGSVLQYHGDWILKCKKWLGYDRPSKRFDQDRQYEFELSQFCHQYGFNFLTFDFAGLQTVVRRMLEIIDTPYLLFLEHDWLCQAPPLDLTTAISLLERHTDIHYIRFNKRDNIISNHDFLLSLEPRDGYIPLLRTTSHSNNPHVVRVATLKDQWAPICFDDPYFKQQALNGTAIGIEEVLFKHHLIDVQRHGFDKAHDKWGTYIAGAFDAPRAVVHLGQ